MGILQTTFSNTFSRMKIFFDWNFTEVCSQRFNDIKLGWPSLLMHICVTGPECVNRFIIILVYIINIIICSI